MADNSPPAPELDRWERRFAGEDYAFGEGPNRFLERCAPLLPPTGAALAVADGEGRNGVWLAERGLTVTSFDLSPRGVDETRALAARRGVSIDAEVTDIHGYPWPEGSYDVVAAIFFQFVPPSRRPEVFAGIARALRPGGLLLLEGYRPEQIALGTGGPPHAENMYTRELLEEAFAAFSEIEIREYDEELAEGPSHHGLSALIDLVGRK
ncbi:MAG: SAM-dependent methyltransferase [Miltoncostaeaceae bacterium]